MPDEILVRKYRPQLGYQLYFASTLANQQLTEGIDQFLSPMFSSEFRKSQKVPEDGGMAVWCYEGRLQASIERQLIERRAGRSTYKGGDRELDYYVDTFKAPPGGMTGPLNWYRTRAINFEEEQMANLAPFPEHIPCLQLPAENDAALPPSMCLAPSVLSCFPGGNLEVKVISNADHWCLQVRLFLLA